MNAIQAYETTLWNSIPYDIRRSISDSVSYGGFNTSYYIFIGTPMWDDRFTIIDTLTKLGYEAKLKQQAFEAFASKDNIIEYKFEIYWDNPRK